MIRFLEIFIILWYNFFDMRSSENAPLAIKKQRNIKRRTNVRIFSVNTARARVLYRVRGEDN